MIWCGIINFMGFASACNLGESGVNWEKCRRKNVCAERYVGKERADLQYG